MTAQTSAARSRCSRRTVTFNPRIFVARSASMTSSASASGTSTSENPSLISMAPIDRDSNPDLAGDRADEIAGADARPPAGADEQPDQIAARPRASMDREAAGRAPASAVAAARLSLDGGAGRRDLPIVALASRRRVRQLHGRRRDVHDVELVRQGFDDDARVVEVAGDQTLAQRRRA